MEIGSLSVRPKAVVWDFNGTLLDDLQVAYGSVQEKFRTYDIVCPTLEQYREEITANFMEFYYQHGFLRSTTAAELNAIRKKYYAENGNKVNLREGVLGTLNWLNAHRFLAGIVSAEVSTTLHSVLVQNRVQRKFDFIKPEAWGSKKEALLQTAEIFDVEPSEMIYIDDSVDGLATAKETGVVPVAFFNSTSYNSKKRLLEVTDVGIENVYEITYLLAQLEG